MLSGCVIDVMHLYITYNLVIYLYILPINTILIQKLFEMVLDINRLYYERTNGNNISENIYV